MSSRLLHRNLPTLACAVVVTAIGAESAMADTGGSRYVPPPPPAKRGKVRTFTVAATTCTREVSGPVRPRSTTVTTARGP
jgi:hypothetical protein